MKIIRKGALPKFRGTCQLCDGEVECDFSELTDIRTDHNKTSYDYVNCPTESCKSRIRVTKIFRATAFYDEGEPI